MGNSGDIEHHWHHAELSFIVEAVPKQVAERQNL